MSCEHLVCAACANPVVEGRCPVCRSARADVHVSGPFGLSVQAVVMIVAAIIVLAAVASQLH